MTLVPFAILLFLGLQIAPGETSISTFSSDQLPANAYFSISGTIFTVETTPMGKTEPYVDIDITARMAQFIGDSQTIDLLLYHSDANNYLGATYDGVNYVCCWQEQFDKGQCTNLGRIIIMDNITNVPVGKFRQWTMTWDNSTWGDNLSLKQHINFDWEGVWSFVIINCGTTDKTEKRDIVTNGEVVMMNPYGQLPGSLWALLPLYFLMVSLYFVVGAVWIVLTYIYRHDIMRLQHGITLVLVLAFLENLISAADYATYNDRGKISLAFNLFSVIFSVLKKTSSYLLLLIVCMGWMIVRPDIEKKKKAALCIIGFLYLGVEGIYEFIAMLRYTPDTQSLNVPEAVEILFLVPASILDFIFLFWIFWSLMQTLLFLKTKRQDEKFRMYKVLAIVLLVAYVLSFTFFCIQLGAQYNGKFTDWWKGWFIFTGYWNILYWILLVVLGVLWRPNANNSRYAYSIQIEDNMEMEPPKGNSPRAHRDQSEELGTRQVEVSSEEPPSDDKDSSQEDIPL
eukprot:TRINITY_DN15168_c0_g1_i1.p1 TRINITY_DN15168_c0_g1~~TRINITY_DN15168_c0_g1_i1.p1  ORF type:complete len:511 (-),score=113.00 TRINITY_DN15168_c0_g1_i1:56-1588(-)